MHTHFPLRGLLGKLLNSVLGARLCVQTHLARHTFMGGAIDTNPSNFQLLCNINCLLHLFREEDSIESII